MTTIMIHEYDDDDDNDEDDDKDDNQGQYPMALCLDSAQSQEPMRRLHTYCPSRPYHHHLIA